MSLHEEFMTVAEAAKERHCTVHAIRHAIYRGKLSAQRMGRTWLIDRESFSFYRPVRSWKKKIDNSPSGE